MNKKKVFELARGFRGRAKNCIRIARERVEKALQYSYRDRRNKKRDMRSLWIQRINAGTRVHGVCLLSPFLFFLTRNILQSNAWPMHNAPISLTNCLDLRWNDENTISYTNIWKHKTIVRTMWHIYYP
jgi:ribosomal protein L20